MRRLLSLLPVVGALTVTAGASASTVTLDPATGVTTYRSGPAAADVTLLEAGSPFRAQLWDQGEELQALAGCVAGVPVTCEGPTGYDIVLGGGNDRYRGFSEILAMTVSGGTGNDTITSLGRDNDVQAGDGEDTVAVNGSGQAAGGAGNDRLYAAELVFGLSGGPGNDLLVSETRPFSQITLTGGAGNDELVARRGTGDIEAGSGDDVAVFKNAWSANGGDGNDWIVSEGASDDGADAGPSTISGGAGNDTIGAINGQSDTVTCGPGRDTVYAEPEDDVAKSCESRLAQPVPSAPVVAAALADAAALPGDLLVVQPPA